MLTGWKVKTPVERRQGMWAGNALVDNFGVAGGGLEGGEEGAERETGKHPPLLDFPESMTTQGGQRGSCAHSPRKRQGRGGGQGTRRLAL